MVRFSVVSAPGIVADLLAEENDYRNDYPDDESEDSEDEDRWEG